MFQTILHALVPVVFVVGLGWLVGRLDILDPQRIRSITTFIVTVALPAALFVGVFSFSPSQLENGRYLLTLTTALMGTWAIGFGLARIAFRSTKPSSSMLALNASFLDLAYFGLPVLAAVIGAQGLLPVIVGNLVVSVFMMPITILLLGAADGAKQESLLENLKSMVAKPLAWTPVLGPVLVLFGVKLLPLAVSSVKLISSAPPTIPRSSPRRRVRHRGQATTFCSGWRARHSGAAIQKRGRGWMQRWLTTGVLRA